MPLTQSTLLVVTVLVSAAAAVLIGFSGRWPNLRESWTIVAALVKLGVVLALLGPVLDGDEPEVTLFPIVAGVDLALRADAAGMIFALSAGVLWLITSVYSIGYVRTLDERHQTRYFASFALCLSATIGLAFAANLVTFFVFYELLTVATYFLVAHAETDEALAAGRKYLAYLLGGGVALLFATAVVQALAPGHDFTPGGFLAGEVSGVAIAGLVLLFALGFGTKAAVMPLHGWLPSAMVAPTPVSALLHAVAVVKAGVFGFARAIGYVVGPEAMADVGAAAVLATFAAVTIVVASLVAFRQDNLKRRLAYSTIAHLSMIVLGLCLVAPDAWAGAFLHITNHAALKITLFFCAGTLHAHAHLDHVSQLDGVGRRMPFTMAAFGVASLGLAGVPPLGGFVSKWFLGAGAIESGEVVFAVVLLGSGLLTAGYLLPIVVRAFFREPRLAMALPGSGHGSGRDDHDHHGHLEFPDREARPLLVAPLLLTAALGLLLGFGDLFGVGALADIAATAVTGGGP
jgi:multicomponent Na+:H+ antiporter subunit D